jgi:hypothetical protein
MMNQKSDTEVIFREVQKFRQRSLWILLLITDLLALIFFGCGIFTQLIVGRAWGSRPMPDSALVIVGALIILLLSVITYAFYRMQLITEVRNDGLSIRFLPLTTQLIPFEHIKTCEARTYHPIREYGGWGIRYGRKGKAYNVSGNLGVQLELIPGKSLLIGSRRPEELAKAIQMKLN